jgi:PAS domain S-box-containing protein
LATASQLGRRSSIAVLVVTATAVAMLGLLMMQTSRQASESSLLGAAGRQRLLSERTALSAIAASQAEPAERGVWTARYREAQREWTAWSDMVAAHAGGTAGGARGTAFLHAAARRADVVALADRVHAAAASRPAQDSLLAAQRAYVGTIDDIVAALELASAHRIERLVQLEAVCVILLLTALGLGVRLALQPTQQRLQATVSALAEREARTRAMLDAMGEGMLLSDADGRLLEWNPSAQRILRFDPAKPVLLADLVTRLVDAHGVPMALDSLPSRRTIATGRPESDVVLGLRDDAGGVGRWLSITTHPLRTDEETAPHAAVVVFRDVTDAQQLEEERAAQAEALELQNRELFAQAEALERGQALFRSLVDTAGSAIVGLGMDGRIFEWNRESELLFGVTRADALGRDYAEDFVPEPHRDRMRGGIAAVLGGTALRNHTGPVRGADGQRRTVIWNITPLRAVADGPVHGLIAAGLDLTEREASDERFRVLFERSSDAHLLLDDHGIIDCNDATLRLLRYDSKDAVTGRTTTDISPRRQPDGRLSVVVGAHMRQLARDRGYHRFEWMHQRSDGSEFPVEVTLTPVRLDGRDAILSVWHDIAERKAVEAALRAARDAAESANRTKSDFMTRMNHELRTPLTAIIGFSRVLLQGKQGTLSEGAQRYTDRIRANGMHLLSLINQILDVAKVEAGRMELEPERVALDQLVREIVHMLESNADMKGIVLRAELPAPQATLVTDATKLRQILINLVGNAIKFTERGEVCITVEVDPGSLRPVSITVRDTGIGIPPDRHQAVFEPFEQADSSTRRQFGGTGLGLSIVKAFAELIGAAIEVESEVGTGTAFTIWLNPTDLELPAPRA